MKPRFNATADGLEIIDPIERHRYQFTTHEEVSPVPVDCDQIPYPIGAAVEVTTEMLTLSTRDTVYVHDEDGTMLEVGPHEQRLLPDGSYVLDLSLPLKVYVHIESPVHIYSDPERTHVALDDTTRAVIGARSYHTRPAETITTTADPADVMQAVSTFGSALKTTAPDRSYPTLRGHPPAIWLGDELAIPDSILPPPEDVVRIEVPPTLRHVFVVTPLAYYLGAAVVPGPEPRLCTDSGYTHAFETDGGDGFESAVARVLKQVFFLDCIVRTEGPIQLPLNERQTIEPILEFDIEAVYDQPRDRQLETYLQQSASTLQPYLPEWQLENIVPATPESVEFLPFIADDLAVIKTADDTESATTVSPACSQAIEEFTRGDFVRRSRTGSGGVPSTTKSPHQTITQRWTGIHSSPITSTTPLSAFHHGIDRTPRDDPIRIDVICNEDDMHAELETVNEVYGTHTELPFDVTVHDDLTTTELSDVLSQATDFCHYIGHIDADGIQCSNGKLDTSSLETVGAKAFVLNACQSHNQGIDLVEAGSIGGIVTLADVVNDGAVSVGSTIARLLNRGFPLYAALDIARQETVVGEQYRLVGDGFTTIAQSETRVPTVCSITQDDDELCVELGMYVGTGTGIGGLFSPHIESTDSYYLLPRNTGTIRMTREEFEELVTAESFPLLFENEIYWDESVLMSAL